MSEEDRELPEYVKTYHDQLLEEFLKNPEFKEVYEGELANLKEIQEKYGEDNE